MLRIPSLPSPTERKNGSPAVRQRSKHPSFSDPRGLKPAGGLCRDRPESDFQDVVGRLNFQQTNCPVASFAIHAETGSRRPVRENPWVGKTALRGDATVSFGRIVPLSFDKVKLVPAATLHECFKVQSHVELAAHHSNCNINRQRVSEMQVLVYSNLSVLMVLLSN